MKKILLVILAWLSPLLSFAAPWPGEPWQQSVNLTSLDNDFVKNLSGTHWNPESRTLWVAVNSPGKFLAIVEDGVGGYKVATQNGIRGEWSPGGDLEGITQVDLAEQAVYVMAEAEGSIRKYDTSVYGVSKLVRSWDIRPYLPVYNGAGPEGIAFIPDGWLVGTDGLPIISQNGMGGLMFVAHQNGGGIYVFDLNPNSSALNFVGSWRTSRSESCGLEFDRSTGKLHILHNLGENYIEVTDMTSTIGADGIKKFRTLVEYTAPKAGNIEGIAFTPNKAREHIYIFTDDDNQNGYALMVFKRFFPEIRKLSLRIASSTDDAEENTAGTVNLTSTDLELTRDTTVQTIGIRFPAFGLSQGANILKANVEFATDEVSSEATQLLIQGEKAIAALAFTTTARNISSRLKTLASVAWAPEAWQALAQTSLSPDLRPVLQELVNQPNWSTTSPVVLLITGTGKRIAEAFNGDKNLAPLLTVEFEP